MKLKNKVKVEKEKLVYKYCDGCGFSTNQELYERQDKKLFCVTCASRNQINLKKPDKDYCSGCGFKSMSIHGESKLVQRKDGHWFHYVYCSSHETLNNEVSKYKKETNKSFRKLIIALGVIIAMLILLVIYFASKNN